MKWMTFCLALMLCACSTTSKIRDRYDVGASDRFTFEIENHEQMTEAGLEVLRTSLQSQLSAIDKLARDGDPDARRIHVLITSYYMRHPAARHTAGIMAGADTIKSQVRILDAQGTELGRIDLFSQNITAWGTAKGLINGHAEKIVDFVTGTRK